MRLNENLNFSRYKWIPSVLDPLLAQVPSKLVLDISAGDGTMKAPVEAAGGAYRGFDLFSPHTEIERWDLDNPLAASCPLEGGAILMDVIEHCNNPGMALPHVADALATGGFLILRMSNPRWSRSRLVTLQYGHLTCFAPRAADLNRHVFTPWPNILEPLLGRAGFQVDRYATLDGRTPWLAGPVILRAPSACRRGYGIVACKLA